MKMHPSARSAFLAILLGATAAPLRAADVPLDDGFRTVPDADKPWAYWWWLKGNVDEASITRDLEAMKRTGFGGLLMFDARGYHEGHVQPPPSRMEFMSPEWRRMLKFSIAEADRLGLKVSVNLSSCAGALKGPWEVGADTPKKLAWAATTVRGPRRLDCAMPMPAVPHFHDIALLAVRLDDTHTAARDPLSTIVLSTDWLDNVGATGACVATAGEVVDLSAKTDAEHRLTWDVPEGCWALLRFASFAIDGHEFDVDVLDPTAVAGHFERMGGAILADAGPLAGRTLSHFYSVSWEGAAPTWTPALEKEFAAYRGYALRPWLPALAGFTVRGPDETARFRRDYFKTLGDCFMNNFYGTLRDLTRKAGLQWHSESGGPWDRRLAAFEHADQLAFLARNDMPQGEFWFPGRAGKMGRAPDLNRAPAMAAHIHGLRLAATEAFTHMVQHWSAYPAVLKPGADSAFCDGINQFVWHTFTASPPKFGLPGVDYFAGTHINPNVTWFPQARPFLDYLGRCQWMLRQGGFVADVAAYLGDRPYQHWGRSTNWSPRATIGMVPGRGYDLLTTEALVARAVPRDGALALVAPADRGGADREIMRYRVLVVDLDDPEIPVEALRRIDELAKAGIPVVVGARRPARSPGLAGQPAADDEVRRLAAPLWAKAPAEPPPKTAPDTTPLETALRGLDLPPDFEGPFDHTHRRDGGTDIYFVAGAGSGDCTFRVKDREPELWDPVTGTIRDAVRWRATADGRTTVPLCLPGTGSVFVVFRRPAGTARLDSVDAPAGAVELLGRDGAGAKVRAWANGDFAAATAAGAPARMAAVDVPAPIEIAGPWTVAFEPNRGAPESAVFETLTDWTAHADPAIRHFAGKGTYRIAFEVDAARAALPARLQLGSLCAIAQVRLNGRDLGVVWTAPWTVDVAGALKAGRNELEIDVVSLWMNRLIGDAALPPEKRITKTNVTLEQGKRTVRVYQGFGSEDPLMPAGLLGPVRLKFARDLVVPL
jgi:hypothetical protein